MWERSHTILLYTTDAPKGIKDSLAILKHCFPIGMPRIVMHQRQPRMQYPIAISRPKKMIQIRLTRKEKPPPPYTTSFPNGKKARLANLKHCRPTGMPMMVMHQRQPASTQASPPINPPNRNQRIFPIVDIVVTYNKNHLERGGFYFSPFLKNGCTAGVATCGIIRQALWICIYIFTARLF